MDGAGRWGWIPAWWLHHPNMTPERLGMLAALATYADSEGFCDPSQSTLARHLGRSRRWANGLLAELEGMDPPVLEKTYRLRSNRGTTSCLYRLFRVKPDGAVVSCSADAKARGAAGTARYGESYPLTGGGNMPLRPPSGSDAPPERLVRTNQAHPEHKQELPPAAPRVAPRPILNSTGPQNGSGIVGGKAGGTTTGVVPTPLPADWRPPAEVMEAARELYPDENLVEHAALFVARCRGKGYAVDPGQAGDLWLSWLIEDQRKARSRRPASPNRQADSSSPAGRRRPSGASAATARFDAWGLAAGAIR